MGRPTTMQLPLAPPLPESMERATSPPMESNGEVVVLQTQPFCDARAPSPQHDACMSTITTNDAAADGHGWHESNDSRCHAHVRSDMHAMNSLHEKDQAERGVACGVTETDGGVCAVNVNEDGSSATHLSVVLAPSRASFCVMDGEDDAACDDDRAADEAQSCCGVHNKNVPLYRSSDDGYVAASEESECDLEATQRPDRMSGGDEGAHSVCHGASGDGLRSFSSLMNAPRKADRVSCDEKGEAGARSGASGDEEDNDDMVDDEEGVLTEWINMVPARMAHPHQYEHPTHLVQ